MKSVADSVLCRLFVAAMMAVCLWACGSGNDFKIEGRLAGGQTMNLVMSYAEGGGIHQEQVGATKGDFTLKGSIEAPVLMTVATGDGRVLGHLYVCPGDEFKVTFDTNKPLVVKVEENEVNARWAKAFADNSEAFASVNSSVVNAAVAKYVKAHPKDIVSTLLVLTRYDASINPTEAASLLASISPEARPVHLTQEFDILAGHATEVNASARVVPFRYVCTYDGSDSSRMFTPSKHSRSLLVFSTRDSGRRDSIVGRLRNLRKDYTDHDLGILDLSLDVDTLAWKSYAERDTATWTQGWVPGSVSARAIDRLAIPRLPYFIVTDSLGRQIYRGPSISQAILKL